MMRFIPPTSEDDRWFLDVVDDAGVVIGRIGHAATGFTGYQLCGYASDELTDAELVGWDRDGYATIEAAKLAFIMDYEAT